MRNKTVMIAAIGIRHQHPDVLTNQLAGIIAKHLFYRIVDPQDSPLGIDGHNPIRNRIYNRINAIFLISQTFIVFNFALVHQVNTPANTPAKKQN